MSAVLIGKLYHVNFDIYLFYCSVDRNKYQIQIPLPPKIDPSVTMMTVEEKPDVTYNDVGGCKEQIEKMREVSLSQIRTQAAIYSSIPLVPLLLDQIFISN